MPPKALTPVAVSGRRPAAVRLRHELLAAEQVERMLVPSALGEAARNRHLADARGQNTRPAWSALGQHRWPCASAADTGQTCRPAAKQRYRARAVSRP